MGEKLPYYMAYPTPLLYDDMRLERRDYEYMRSLYPDMAKRALPYVEDECDRCEGPCSVMYDEYPDRLQLRMMCKRIYNRMMEDERFFHTWNAENLRIDEEKKHAETSKEMQAEKRQDWLYDLIEVLLLQELCRRRTDDRRTRERVTFCTPFDNTLD